MNTFKTLPFVVVTAMLLTVAGCNNPGMASNKNSSNDSLPDKGFALLELYTSEGCSSCPPADRLLARVQKEAGNRPIFLLCEHVDYWDDAHWKDAFSQHEFSQRQYRYDSRLKSQVYTPQLIINGTRECLGSNEAAVNAAVKNAVAKETKVNLDLKVRKQGNNIQISYSINGNSPADKLLIAVVEKHAVREIGDGENRGRTLNHAQIVRSLSSFSITGNKGIEQISLPVDYNAGNYEIVGFLQNESTNEIVSAVRAQDNG